MAVRDVRLFGDPVLNTRADEVSVFDASLHTLVADMLETMDHHRGVGLAANQVGVTRRVIVFDCDGVRGHVINPAWEAVDEQTEVATEGCLSIPQVLKDTERYAAVKVTGYDMHGGPVEFRATGLLARCVQHETDHVDGVLFLKRLSPQLRKQAMQEIRESSWFND